MKIKLLISTLLCLLVFSKINAQTAVQWTNVLGQGGADNAYRSAVDKDGNIVVVGFFTDSVQFGATLLRSRGKQDIFIAKYRPTGSLVWAKTAGGPENDVARNVTTDASGSIYVSGEVSTLNPTVGATNTDTAFFDAIKILSGSATRYSQTGSNAFLAKLSANGDFQFVKTAFSKYDCFGMGLTVDTEGAIYMAGVFRDTMQIGSLQVVQPWVLNGAGSQFSIRGPDNFLAKFDALGSIQWLKQTKTTWANRGIDAVVKAAADGKIYWAGEYLDSVRIDTFNVVNGASGFGDEMFVMRLTKAGNTEWIRRITSAGDDWVANIDVDSQGNTYVAGSFTSTLTIDTTAATANGGRDVFLTKLNNTGRALWLQTAGGAGTERVRDMVRTTNGDIFLAGDFSGLASLWNAAGKDTLVSAGSNDAFIAQYTKDGAYVTAKRWGTVNFDTYAGLASNKGDTLLATGWFRGTTVSIPLSISLTPTTQTSFNATNNDAVVQSVYFCPKTPLPVSIVGNTTFCDGDSVKLSLPSGFSKYWWSTGDSVQTLKVTSQNTYFGRYSNRNECVVSTITEPIFITVKGAPPVPTIRRNLDTLFASPSSNYVFQWFLNETAIPSATNNFLKVTQNGNYRVSIKAANGCDKSAVFNLTNVSVRSIFEGATMQIAPNPAQNTTTVLLQLDKPQSIRLNVINAFGQVVLAQNQILAVGENRLNLDTQNLISGLYFIKIENKEGQFLIQKLVRE